MSKSDWTSGVYLTPDFCQDYFGTSAATGHNHQGLDSSGSAPQIALSNSVSDVTTDGTVTVTIPVPFADVATDVVCYYQVTANQVLFSMPDGVFGHSTANEYFRMEPKTVWPAEIIPASAHWVPIVCVPEAAALTTVAGVVAVLTDATDAWKGYLLIDGTYSLTGWGFNEMNAKGYAGGSFTYSKW